MGYLITLYLFDSSSKCLAFISFFGYPSLSSSDIPIHLSPVFLLLSSHLISVSKFLVIFYTYFISKFAVFLRKHFYFIIFVPISCLAMVNLGNLKMVFMGLSSGDDISDASSRTRVVSYDILDVVPLVVRSLLANFIEISDDSDSRGSSEDDGDKFWAL